MTVHNHLRPWRGSDLSRDCGLMSVINLLRCAVGSQFLNQRASEELYAIGMDYLMRRGFLKGILKEGIGDRQHLDLLYYLCRNVERRFDIRLRIERPYRKRRRPVSMDVIASTAEKFLAKHNTAVLIAWETIENAHLTVVRAVAPSGFMLSDSGLRTRLPFEACSTALSAHRRGYRYYIYTESVMFLSRDPTAR